MCFCGGGVCAGTSGCQAFVQSAQPMAQVSYNYAQVALGQVQAFFAGFFALVESHLTRVRQGVTRSFYNRARFFRSG